MVSSYSKPMSTVYEKQIKKKRAKFAPINVGTPTATATNSEAEVKHIIPTGDIRKVKGQNFLVLSYACPDGVTRVRSPKGLVMKFSGTFPDRELAEEHANLIRNEDPRFDVFVVDLYVWGQVPLPNEDKPFISSHYTDEMLTRIVGGLQRSMTQGKKEQEERKARDRKKAEDAMRRVKGNDYKMPEKSKLVERYESDVLKDREEEAKKAAEEKRPLKIMYSEEMLMNAVMSFCIEHNGRVVDATMGSEFMKYIIKHSIEREAEARRVHDREIGKEDEHPDVLRKAYDEQEERKKKEAEAAKNE